uniref:Uncharacterized protein n=1 Tax=Pithovirus LCPAC101 TaxID=2506586 RepID=A0A481Z4D6_9VIRU|nr:MAG: hypothetical protein LCPAC101_01910 [Pithovirus LCPAC101]
MSYLDELPPELICVVCDHLVYLYDIDTLLDVYGRTNEWCRNVISSTKLKKNYSEYWNLYLVYKDAWNNNHSVGPRYFDIPVSRYRLWSQLYRNNNEWKLWALYTPHTLAYYNHLFHNSLSCGCTEIIKLLWYYPNIEKSFSLSIDTKYVYESMKMLLSLEGLSSFEYAITSKDISKDTEETPLMKTDTDTNNVIKIDKIENLISCDKIMKYGSTTCLKLMLDDPRLPTSYIIKVFNMSVISGKHTFIDILSNKYIILKKNSPSTINSMMKLVIKLTNRCPQQYNLYFLNKYIYCIQMLLRKSNMKYSELPRQIRHKIIKWIKKYKYVNPLLKEIIKDKCQQE